MSTTTSEQITQVRARLADMRERLGEEAVTHQEKDDSLLLRLVAHAEDVLDRHRLSVRFGDTCAAHDVRWSTCPEIAAVIKAWTL